MTSPFDSSGNSGYAHLWRIDKGVYYGHLVTFLTRTAERLYVRRTRKRGLYCKRNTSVYEVVNLAQRLTSSGDLSFFGLRWTQLLGNIIRIYVHNPLRRQQHF